MVFNKQQQWTAFFFFTLSVPETNNLFVPWIVYECHSQSLNTSFVWIC